MDNSDMAAEILGYMADMDEEGCELKFIDESVKNLFDAYKESGIHEEKDRVQFIKAVSGDESTEITLTYATDSEQVTTLTCPTRIFLKSAQLVLQQADFIIKNPQMFVGCEVEI